MKFLFVVNKYPPSQGGVQTHVANLAEALVLLGHECNVITLANQNNIVTRNGVRVVTLPSFLNVGNVVSFPIPRSKLKIEQFIKSEQIDVVSVHTRFFPMTWIGIWAARKQSKVSILTEHGSDFVKGVPLGTKAASMIIDMTLGKAVMKMASVCLAISESSQQFVKRLSGRESMVFYNAINVQNWTSKQLISENRLIFVGRFVQGKGWKDSILAFERLASQHPNLQLDLFGEGPEIDSAKNMIGKSPYRSRINLRGSQSPSLIQKFLSGAVFLNPTVLSEGFQTTLLEAFAAGARIVSYTTPGISALRRSGAQIWEAQNFEEFVIQTNEALTALPHIPAEDQLLTWDWSQRSKEFELIAKEALNLMN